MNRRGLYFTNDDVKNNLMLNGADLWRLMLTVSLYIFSGYDFYYNE